jgi:queuosine precursor transporter
MPAPRRRRGVAMRIPLPVAATRRTGASVLAAAAVACFIAATAAANLATARYGLWPVGFGLSATAGSYAAGLVLAARDWVHETAGRAAVFGCIAAGALASAVTAGPRLAAASAGAFAIAETVDLLVYTPLRRRSWVVAVLASNTVGAIADTLLFLRLAGFGTSTSVVVGQMVAKTTATMAVLAAAVGIRALLRHRLQPPGA